MKAQVYNHQCQLVAELDGLPDNLQEAAEDFESSMQEAVLGGGFDCIQGGTQIMPVPCEVHRVVFNGRYALDVAHVELLTRYSLDWCLDGGYMHDAENPQ